MFSFLEWLFNPPAYSPAPPTPPEDDDDLLDRLDYLEAENDRLRQRMASLEQDLIALRRRIA
jgi:hypothetical protein